MSQENVDRFTAGLEAFNRRDIPGLVRIWIPRSVRTSVGGAEGDYSGVDEVTAWFTDLAEHFESWRIVCPDIRDLGDRVLALGTVQGTGAESGVETELPTRSWRLQGRLITHYIDYGDREKALEAAGLSG